MSVDFRRSGFMQKEAMLLADASGDGAVGQVVFLATGSGSDRMHRMDLSRLRRFSIDRESKAVALTAYGLIGGLMLLFTLACLAIDEDGVRLFFVCLFGVFTLLAGLWFASCLVKPFVSLTFQDAGRTRSFKTWTTKRKLDRFTRRLEAAVAVAQQPPKRP